MGSRMGCQIRGNLLVSLMDFILTYRPLTYL
jgi:hypothetical protein